MNKRGHGWEIGIAISMIVLTIAGISAILSEGNKVYVGDKISMHYYDYSQCSEKVDNLTKSNVIIFDSENQAQTSGFTKSDTCG